MPDSTSPRVPRHDGWTPRVRALFLQQLATTGMVRPALAAVGRSSSAAYALRRRDPSFRAEWDCALADAVAPVETMLVERALSGEWIRTLDAQGREVAAEHRFDSRFALRLLSRLDRKAEWLSAPNSLKDRSNPPQSAQSGHKADGSGSTARS